MATVTYGDLFNPSLSKPLEAWMTKQAVPALQAAAADPSRDYAQLLVDMRMASSDLASELKLDSLQRQCVTSWREHMFQKTATLSILQWLRGELERCRAKLSADRPVRARAEIRSQLMAQAERLQLSVEARDDVVSLMEAKFTAASEQYRTQEGEDLSRFWQVFGPRRRSWLAGLED